MATLEGELGGVGAQAPTSSAFLQHFLVAASVAAILAPFSYYMGLGARMLKLPQITGYLVSGIVCGPYLLGILSHESVSDLNIIEGACLAIIGLAAGAELHLSELSRSKRQVSHRDPAHRRPRPPRLPFSLLSPRPHHPITHTSTGAGHHLWHLRCHVGVLLRRVRVHGGHAAQVRADGRGARGGSGLAGCHTHDGAVTGVRGGCCGYMELRGLVELRGQGKGGKVWGEGGLQGRLGVVKCTRPWAGVRAVLSTQDWTRRSPIEERPATLLNEASGPDWGHEHDVPLQEALGRHSARLHSCSKSHHTHAQFHTQPSCSAAWLATHSHPPLATPGNPFPSVTALHRSPLLPGLR